MKTWGFARGLLGGVLLLPLAYTFLAGVGAGVPTAEGCGGAASGPNGVPLGVTMEYPPLADSVSISTAGLILFTARFPPEQADAELAAFAVEVLDEASMPVTGQLRTLWRRDGATVDLLLGWEAAAPLPIGKKLTVSGRSFVVSGEAAPLPEPTVTLGQWQTAVVGRGGTVTCQAWCASHSFMADEVSLRQVTATLEQLPPQLVAWQLSLEPSVVAETPVISSILLGGSEVEISLEQAALRALIDWEAAEYCFVPSLTDLRTGERVEGDEICKAAGPAVETINEVDDALRQCTQPPSFPSLRDRWCTALSMSPAIGNQYCIPPGPIADPNAGSASGSSAGGAAQQGQGGTAQTVAGGMGQTAPGGTAQQAPRGPAAAASNTSEGCSMGSVPAGHHWGAIAVTLLLVALRRRRRP